MWGSFDDSAARKNKDARHLEVVGRSIICVLFDRWYAAGKLIKFIRRQGWYVICALKSNRKLNSIQVDEWDRQLMSSRMIGVSECD